jgi:heparan-alpha-glucosaminide N-acetyltransferase
MNTPANSEAAPRVSQRLISIDAYRGLVMFLMMAEVLAIGAMTKTFPESAFWKFLHWQQDHVEWIGCVLHDLIQPSFSFLVGVALPFSIASRIAKGATFGNMFAHAAWRAFALTALGVLLRSIDRPLTYFTFEDTLSQIGLGYIFLFLLGLRSARVQWAGFIILVVGYWAAFALYPLPGPNFDWAAVGVPADWPHHLSGFTAHWDKNSNLAWAFDRWFLNLFPREKPFTFNGGGYATLSFIPTLATMVLGLLAGNWLRADLTHREKLMRFLIAGIAGIVLGVVLHLLDVCPIVKRIWTPTWVLFSGGWCFLFLGAFYALVEVRRLGAWLWPLTVIGVNSIAAYVIAHICEHFIGSALRTHLGAWLLPWFGAYRPFVQGVMIFVVMWLMLVCMYRRRIFLKI